MCVTFKAGMVGDIIIFIALIASFKYRFIALYMGNSPNKSKKNEKEISSTSLVIIGTIAVLPRYVNQR